MLVNASPGYIKPQRNKILRKRLSLNLGNKIVLDVDCIGAEALCNCSK